MKLSSLTSAILLALGSASVANAAETAQQTPDADKQIERVRIIGHESGLRTEPGSATLIDELELEAFEYDDIARVLANVPGVNIREEDGFGLRPNIGFRGVTPERSKKIALMEDGILISPAPYSAPAAYYFPLVSRMTAVEVFKGPAAIQYGPNTVAGALNLVTRQVPNGAEGGVDMSIGSDGFDKIHAHYGDTIDNFGFLVEGIQLQSDGFKELDGGGETGFDKTDFMAKFRYDFSQWGYDHLVELKLGYGEETSNETYLGLSDEDFAETPFRRYAVTQLGNMDWSHSQVMLTHAMTAKNFSMTTRVYRNDFERAWRKFNDFVGDVPSVEAILRNPDQYQDFYQMLTGEADSTVNLAIGTNDREYYSQGIQSDLDWQIDWMGYDHTVSFGWRFHQDQIERNHFEEQYVMRSGKLERTNIPTNYPAVNREKADAWSVYIQDAITLDALTLTAGVRGEFIDSEYQNLAEGKSEDWLEKSTQVWLPSLSGFYKLNEQVGFLFGVHEGYIPTSPKQDPRIEPEKSINYEVGTRFALEQTNGEVVAFFTDYENLKESCTFSSSSVCASQIDQEYNGGAVDIFGLESSIAHTFALTGDIDMPVSLVYTYTKGEFKQALDSDFSMWGNVVAGDPLPYLPEHQTTLNIGLSATDWQVSLLIRYVGEMNETAGSGEVYSGVKTEALTVVDLSASYDFGDKGIVYAKIDNVLDEVEVVSHRPFGARPSKPQQFFIGYKYQF